MDTICTTALPGIGIGILLCLSEILPFVSTVKANGITEVIVNVLLEYLKKKKREIDLEYQRSDIAPDESTEIESLIQ